MIVVALLVLAVVCGVFWVVGLVAHILGVAIHIFLVLALLALLGSFVLGRRTAGE
jgi:hypothetical protein